MTADTVAATTPARPRSQVAVQLADRYVMIAYTLLAVIYLLLPVAVIILFSFNDPAGRSNFIWQGFTLKYWLNPFGVAGLFDAVSLSILIALLSTLFATALGTLVAIALERYRFRGRGPINSLIFLPMATPEIIMGASLLTLFVAIGNPPFFPLNFITILIAHIMFNISFVVVTVRARLAGFPRHLEEAAADLYANEWQVFWKVTFPLILPGIIAAALLAFSLSIDDFVITNFSAGKTQTFPMYIYAKYRIGIPVQVNVIGTVIFLVAVGAVLLTTVSGAGAAEDAMTTTRHAAGHPGAPLPDRSVVPPVWGRITNLVVDHGAGCWLVTPEGERYLDYTSGIGVTNTGHAHPRVVAAIQAQAAKLLHGQQNIVYHEPGLRLHDRLAHLLPGGPWSVFLANSGAEAVEAAVKLARVATGRPVIVGFRYAFHGRIGNAMALTAAKDVYRAAFEPLPGSIYHTAYPYCYRAPGGAHDPAACTCDWEEQLDLLFHQLVFPEKVAAIIVEPVIGEGGYLVPPPDFLPRLRALTARHGILLVADEVQTGFARTGEIFAVRHWDVEPDILVMAKGIASGMPLSGIIARTDLMERLAPGSHGGTYGGNVVACAAAMATLDVIEEEGLADNARERGTQLLAGLRALQAAHPSIGDVRGLGLMVALELVKPGEGDGRVPDAALTKRVQQECFARRLLVLTAGTAVNVVRIIPPLVTTAAEVDLALGIFGEALDAAGA